MGEPLHAMLICALSDAQRENRSLSAHRDGFRLPQQRVNFADSSAAAPL